MVMQRRTGKRPSGRFGRINPVDACANILMLASVSDIDFVVQTETRACMTKVIRDCAFWCAIRKSRPRITSSHRA